MYLAYSYENGGSETDDGDENEDRQNFDINDTPRTSPLTPLTPTTDTSLSSAPSHFSVTLFTSIGVHMSITSRRAMTLIVLLVFAVMALLSVTVFEVAGIRKGHIRGGMGKLEGSEGYKRGC